MSNSIYNRIFCAIQSFHPCALCWFMLDLLFYLSKIPPFISYLNLILSGLFCFFFFNFYLRNDSVENDFIFFLWPFKHVRVCLCFALLCSSVALVLFSSLPKNTIIVRRNSCCTASLFLSKNIFLISIFFPLFLSLLLIYLWWREAERSAPLVNTKFRGPFETGTFFNSIQWWCHAASNLWI